MSSMRFMSNNSATKKRTAGQKTVTRMYYLMGTFFEIEADGESIDHAIEAIEEAFKEIKRIECVLSRFLENSLTFEINRTAGSSPVKVTEEVFGLIERAVRTSQVTSGAFDITVAPLMELWSLAQEREALPSKSEISQTLLKVGYKNIILNPRDKTVSFERPGFKIDFGSMGKGHAVDQAVDVLRSYNIKRALINSGGSLFCLDEEEGRFGIKNPIENDEIVVTIPLKDNAVSTSANYERFFRIKGKNYGHLIDPRTGYPVHNNVLSVTTIAPSAAIADILSTAIFSLGLKNGMALIDKVHDAAGFIITKGLSGIKCHSSAGFKEVL